MAKFSGLVGYVTQEETSPGVWTDVEKPRKMKGDVINQSSHNRSGEYLHDDVSLNHRISVIGDSHAFSNYTNIKWVEIDSIKWRVTAIEIKRPRLLLNIGGIWNE